MDEKDAKQEQIDIAEGLQLKWLKRMDKMFDDGTITSTDMATLVRFLTANGWNLDPARIPKGLRDKLTSVIDPTELDDEDVVGIIGKQQRKA
jgi:hypothetical protein